MYFLNKHYKCACFYFIQNNDNTIETINAITKFNDSTATSKTMDKNHPIPTTEMSSNGDSYSNKTTMKSTIESSPNEYFMTTDEIEQGKPEL